MSNAQQIMAMLRSRVEGDDDQFYSIALQVAAAEARQGHRTTADELRAAVDDARSKSSKGASVAIPFSRPRGDLESLIDLKATKLNLSDVVLNHSIIKQLDGGSAPRIREEHGRRLQAELVSALRGADGTLTRDNRLGPPSGVYLEVELRSGDKASILERKNDRIRPGATHLEERNTTTVALFVPDEARPVLEEILRDYTSGPLTEAPFKFGRSHKLVGLTASLADGSI